MARTDVLVVSLGATGGWRAAARALTAAIGAAGASVAIVEAAPPPRVRTFALTDLTQAWLCRRAALTGIARHDPRAIVYCSITAALLWPRAGAIFADSIAAENRPGRHGLWQRPLERRRLRQTPLILAWSDGALARLRSAHAEIVVVPPPVEGSLPSGSRDVAAVTYAGDPEKRRLDLVLAAWARVRRPGETLVVAGTDVDGAGDGVRGTGMLAPADFRALLARTRVFIAAPRREEFGIAPLEALAQGCVLVTTPSPGPYPALSLARALDPRLVSDDLAAAIRTALDDPRPEYARRAARLLEPFTRETVDRIVAERVLPRLVAR